MRKLWPKALAILTYLILLGLIANYTYISYPHSGDEYSIFFQSKIFSSLQFSAKAPAYSDFLSPHYTESYGGRWISQYPPLYSLFMSIGWIFNYPLLIVLLLCGANILLLERILEKLKIKGLHKNLFLLWFAFSPSFFFYSMSYYNHPGTLFLTLLSLSFWLSYLETKCERTLTYLLMALSFGAGIRPLTMFLITLPIGFHIFYRSIKERSYKRILKLIFIPLGILLTLQLLIALQTGKFFVIPYAHAGNNLEKIGLHHFLDHPFDRLYARIEDAGRWLFSFGYFHHGHLKWKNQLDWNLGVPLFLVGWFWLLIKGIKSKGIKSKDRHRDFYIILFSITTLLVLGHLSYSYQGGRYGARFFFESFWMVMLGLFFFIDDLQKEILKKIKWNLTVPVICTLILPNLIYHLPKTVTFFKRDNTDKLSLILKAEEIQSKDCDNDIMIFIKSSKNYDVSWFLRNSPDLSGIIYAVYNEGMYPYLAASFPGRKKYLYETIEGKDQFTLLGQ